MKRFIWRHQEEIKEVGIHVELRRQFNKTRRFMGNRTWFCCLLRLGKKQRYDGARARLEGAMKRMLQQKKAHVDSKRSRAKWRTLAALWRESRRCYQEMEEIAKENSEYEARLRHRMSQIIFVRVNKTAIR